jgi:Tol biopolymer transport system component/predicted Ser/Thr protein kinase
LLDSFEEAGDFIERPLVEHSLASQGSPATRAESLVGSRIGDYEILSLLGVGGMGEVYLARDGRLDRQVALKLLPAQFTRDPSQVERFEREARAASALNHPNIITIYEVGRKRGAYFIAAEFVEGRTLRDVIAEGKATTRESLSIAVQIADALVASHAAGIVHRDIKPENVMARPDGLVKVLDFGLAKPAEQRWPAEQKSRDDGNGRALFHFAPPDSPGAPRAEATDPAFLMGTLAYLSPEQARRQTVDHRSDIFSLGVTLYEMVAGERPYGSDDARALYDEIVSEAPVSMRRADIPPPIKRVIRRALEKDRAARYQTARELRDDLRRLARESEEAGAGVFSSRRGTLAAILGALAVMSLTLTLALRSGNGLPAAPFSAGAVRKITFMAGEEIFPSLAPDGKSVVYASRVSGNWDIYLQKIGEQQAVNLTGDSPDVDLAPAFSPDGTRIAFTSSRDRQGVYLMDRDGRNVRRLCADGHNPAWSPDGEEIALAEDRIFDYEGRIFGHSRLFVVNVRTGVSRQITGGDAVQPNWSPHGTRIAYWGAHKGGRLDIWTVATAGADGAPGAATPVAVTEDSAADWNPVWSRDGKYLYFLSNRGGSMNLWRAPMDEPSGRVTGAIEPVTLPSARCQHMSFSADGRSLIYSEVVRSENTWQTSFDPATGFVKGQSVQITRGARRYSCPDPAPDEKSIAFVTAGESQEDLFVLDRDSGQVRQLTNDAAMNRAPRWSPDGRQIAFVSDREGRNEIWKVNQDGSGLSRLAPASVTGLLNPVWSPDGRQLLYQMSDANSYIIEPERADLPPHPLEGRQEPGFFPWSWSPDGKRLAGWQFRADHPGSGIVVYSFADARYERLTDRGTNPVWLNDNRRLLYINMGKMYLLDSRSGETRDLYSVEPNNFTRFTLSRDNRRIYYSLFSTEANLWLLSLN